MPGAGSLIPFPLNIISGEIRVQGPFGAFLTPPLYVSQGRYALWEFHLR